MKDNLCDPCENLATFAVKTTSVTAYLKNFVRKRGK